MPDGYTRVIVANKNRLTQGCGTLLGMAAGLLADRQLNDAEIEFLKQWLSANEIVCEEWPGDVVYERVKAVLADGVITQSERAHLIQTLESICGGTLERNLQSAVNQLAFDDGVAVHFSGSLFCVTGEFVFGPRDRVCEEISDRGGVVQKGVTRNLNYLVVGLHGSDEWKHGSYGTKVLKAIEYKKAGLPIYIVREDSWTSALRQ